MLINNVTNQREPLTEWHIRLPLTINKVIYALIHLFTFLHYHYLGWGPGTKVGTRESGPRRYFQNCRFFSVKQTLYLTWHVFKEKMLNFLQTVKDSLGILWHWQFLLITTKGSYSSFHLKRKGQNGGNCHHQRCYYTLCHHRQGK